MLNSNAILGASDLLTEHEGLERMEQQLGREPGQQAVHPAVRRHGGVMAA